MRIYLSFGVVKVDSATIKTTVSGGWGDYLAGNYYLLPSSLETIWKIK